MLRLAALLFFESVNLLWHYHAYDLHFVCDFELPELTPWAGDPSHAPDVSIFTGAQLTCDFVERAAAQGETMEWDVQRSRLLFQLARFTVSDGCHILIEPVEGYTASSWRLPLLGSVLAILLEQRGLFALHAGALVFGHSAAAFVGDKGQGKSTLNAALSVAGFPLLSDDVVGLQMSDDSLAPVALSGFSQVKLAPTAVQQVTGTDAMRWAAVAPELDDMDKCSFEAPLASKPQPLRALFLLHWTDLDENEANADATIEANADATIEANADATIEANADATIEANADATIEANADATIEANADATIEANADADSMDAVTLRRLNVQEALAQLIPHSFGARFGATYLQGERRKTHFLSCARLAGSCAVWKLTRPRDLALLPATIAQIARVMAEIDTDDDSAPTSP